MKALVYINHGSRALSEQTPAAYTEGQLRDMASELAKRFREKFADAVDVSVAIPVEVFVLPESAVEVDLTGASPVVVTGGLTPIRHVMLPTMTIWSDPPKKR